MATRSEILPRLSTIPTEELLELLGDDTIFDLAAKCFQSNDSTTANVVEASVSVEGAALSTHTEPAKDKAKRPLNAFMAFRSYYVKIFPDVQQKAVSGFLTTLWNQEPCRNRWALIAKVYSFVRDEVGKGKMSLAQFLQICCPIMRIIEPSAYLLSLGWTVQNTDDGSQRLIRNNAGSTISFTELESQRFPNTEQDLLKALFDTGFLPEEGMELMKKINANRSAIMTTTLAPTLPVPSTTEKLDFINTLRGDPVRATSELFGTHFDEQMLREHGYRVHDASDLTIIGHLPMALPAPVPIRPYQFMTTTSNMDMNGNRPIMSWSRVPDYDCFDIDNPFHLDHLLGFTQMGGDQTASLPPSPPYQVEDDYHFMF